MKGKAGPESRRWGAFAGVTFILHWSWEILQGPLYEDFAGMSLADHALPCAVAALGDVVLAGLAYAAVSVAVRRWAWPYEQHWFMPVTIWVAVGLIVTTLIEVLATRMGWWSYGAKMPTIFGIGLSPLAQWTVVPVASVLLLSRKSLLPRQRGAG